MSIQDKNKPNTSTAPPEIASIERKQFDLELPKPKDTNDLAGIIWSEPLMTGKDDFWAMPVKFDESLTAKLEALRINKEFLDVSKTYKDIYDIVADETQKEIDNDFIDEMVKASSPMEANYYAPYPPVEKLTLKSEDIEYFRKRYEDHIKNGRGKAAEKFKKQAEVLEDAVVIYKERRLPERKIFYVDAGETKPESIKEYIENLTEIEVTDWSYWDARAGIKGE